MLIIGLTGGIGSGKTTVARLFAEYGVTVIDTDVIARELVQPGLPAYNAIVQHFGPDMTTDDNTLDRQKLREQVFSNESKRQQLESILHPLIREEVRKQLDKINGDTIHRKYCIVVIPLLAEKGGYEFLQRVLVVDTPLELQIQRTLARDNISPESLQKIIASQADRQSRLAIADDCIENKGDIDDLRRQVALLHETYLKTALEK